MSPCFSQQKVAAKVCACEGVVVVQLEGLLRKLCHGLREFQPKLLVLWIVLRTGVEVVDAEEDVGDLGVRVL
jgi:hypothetical protein